MEQELSFQKRLQKNTKTKTKTKTETKTKTKKNTKEKTKTKAKTKTKNEKDPTCAIFSESRGCKDIKYDLFTKKLSQNFHEISRNVPKVFEKFSRNL